jgi:DHA1 family chloramphenicol resistance protein-like MFS transporter
VREFETDRSIIRAEPPARVPSVVYVLGAGVFAVGTSEFMIAGLLPEIARDLGASVPSTGFLVSAFAIGMLVGAPVTAVATLRLPQRATLVGALAAVAAGHVIGALATTYGVLLTSRVISAVATGAFWAVAAVVAVSRTPVAARGRALATLVGGLTVANVAGVPAGTALGQELGWRSAFWAVTVFALLAVAGVALSVRPTGERPRPSVAAEVRAFRQPRLWVALATTALFQAGIMGTITYVGPLLLDVSHLREPLVPLVFSAVGIGSVLGTALGGRVGDAHPWPTLYGGLAALATVYALLAILASSAAAAVALLVVSGVAGFAVAAPLNARIFALAGSAPTLTSAANVSAFNVGNTIGPWVGGIALAAGAGLRAPAWLGAVLATGALGLGLLSRHLDRRAVPPVPSEEPAVGGPAGELVPAGELELAQHRGDVGLDGLHGDEELASHLLVGVAARDEAHHLALAGGEPVELVLDGGDLPRARAERVQHEPCETR